ncbi:GIY-YIG nuclease family protein [Paenibacillus planticolens]|uniref:GIY-YIG domain-containing protein n=1 Tax=Paenibacillus planticolens TaxID=2654976 RepID=A0ABX1ZEB8_9BACL|nr:GIY-YIG nuclease family protein [Paenibacillus planticolens]NOU98453.1 hypothetical protein [Paenibacillus planticolens]
MEYVVYSITTLHNGIKYFGRSQEYPKRRRAHLNMLRTNKHANVRMQEAFNQYGEDNFVFEVLHTFNNLQEATEREQQYIDDQSIEKYNVGDAIDGGDTFTRNPRKEEIRHLKHERNAGINNPMYGKPKSEKTIARIKEANSKPIVVDGIVYDSTSEYARLIGVGPTTVLYRINSERFPNYQRVERKNA